MAILMIEDEFLVAAEIRFHLERAGWSEVTHAATESDALAAIQAGAWEAAVVDANLNGQGINEIAAALRDKGVPFIIVTGYGRNGLPKAVADAPVIDKPFRPKTLVDAVARLCAQRTG
jgi:DNA-binding response OmpR family regulator